MLWAVSTVIGHANGLHISLFRRSSPESAEAQDLHYYLAPHEHLAEYFPCCTVTN